MMNTNNDEFLSPEDLEGAVPIDTPTLPTPTPTPLPASPSVGTLHTNPNSIPSLSNFIITHPDEIPRPETTEHAFRRFEPVLALALSRFQTEVDPSTISQRMSARTFISRIRDAVLGYEKFGYKSSKIDRYAPLRYLKYTPLSGGLNGKGRVLITNTSRPPDGLSNRISVTYDKEQVLKICKGIEAREDRYMDDFYLIFSSADEETWILSLMSDYNVIVTKKNINMYHLHP